MSTFAPNPEPDTFTRQVALADDYDHKLFIVWTGENAYFWIGPRDAGKDHMLEALSKGKGHALDPADWKPEHVYSGSMGDRVCQMFAPYLDGQADREAVRSALRALMKAYWTVHPLDLNEES